MAERDGDDDEDALRRVSGREAARSLRALRSTIDELDRTLLRALAHRMVTVDAIAALKREQRLPVRDPVRETLLLDERAAYGASLGLERDFVQSLFERVLAASRLRQERQMVSEIADDRREEPPRS